MGKLDTTEFFLKNCVVFLGATKANNSSNTKSHFQHTHAYTSSHHVTTLSRTTGVPDVYRTLQTDQNILYNYCYVGHTSIYLEHVVDTSIRKSANPFLVIIAILLFSTRHRGKILLSKWVGHRSDNKISQMSKKRR